MWMLKTLLSNKITAGESGGGRRKAALPVNYRQLYLYSAGIFGT